MKKQILCLLAALMLLLGLSVSASAYESAHVFDYAGLLTDSEAGALEARCQDAEDTYGCGVYIVTVDDYSLYYDAGSIENFSDEEILWAADALNSLPRRNLGYCTPEELFEAFLDTIYAA